MDAQITRIAGLSIQLRLRPALVAAVVRHVNADALAGVQAP